CKRSKLNSACSVLLRPKNSSPLPLPVAADACAGVIWNGDGSWNVEVQPTQEIGWLFEPNRVNPMVCRVRPVPPVCDTSNAKPTLAPETQPNAPVVGVLDLSVRPDVLAMASPLGTSIGVMNPVSIVPPPALG